MAVTGKGMVVINGTAVCIDGVSIAGPDDKTILQIGRAIIAVANDPAGWDVYDCSVP